MCLDKKLFEDICIYVYVDFWTRGISLGIFKMMSSKNHSIKIGIQIYYPLSW